MKTHTGSARQTQSRKTVHGDHLDALLEHKSDNPFLKMVRWFFFYTEESGRPLDTRHLHGKSLAH